MEFNNKNSSPTNVPWYSSWFNEALYDDVYSHRSELEAEVAVRLLKELISPYANDLTQEYILDIGCGSCRHLPSLSSLSNNIIGLDLSFRQLQNGKNLLFKSGSQLVDQLILSDMRYLPVQKNSIRLITNFFTSFGYFSCDFEHQATLLNWASSLKDNGLIFIDLFNRNFVLDSLSPHTDTKLNSYSIEQKRKLSVDKKRVNKKITITRGDKSHVFNESVRLFSLEELTKMLCIAGLKIRDIRGSYLGSDYSNSSERLIILAQKI